MRPRKPQPQPASQLFEPGETILQTVHLAIVNKRKALGLTRNQAYLWMVLDSIQGVNENCHAGLKYILDLQGGSKSDLSYNLKVLEDFGYVEVTNRNPDGTVPDRKLALRDTTPLRRLLKLKPLDGRKPEGTPQAKSTKPHNPMPLQDGIMQLSSDERARQLLAFETLFPTSTYGGSDREPYRRALRASIDADNRKATK